MIYEYGSKEAKAAAKVKDHLQGYVDKALKGEEINLKELAIDCTNVIQSLYEEDNTPLYTPTPELKRVVGVSFTQKEDGHIVVNLLTE